MGNNITDGQLECKYCGSMIAEGDLLCMGCGAKVEVTAKAAEPVAEEAAEEVPVMEAVEAEEAAEEVPTMEAVEAEEAAEEVPVMEAVEAEEAAEEVPAMEAVEAEEAAEEIPVMEEKAKAAPVMLNEWFAMGGDLDNALGGNNKKMPVSGESKPVEVPTWASLASEPVSGESKPAEVPTWASLASEPVSGESKPAEVPTWDSMASAPVYEESKPVAEKPAGASSGKPMDRLMFMDIAQAPRPQKPAEPARSTPIPEETTMSGPGGWRCQSCGMPVPEGTTHCWKCSSFESAMDDVVSRNQSFDFGAFLEEKKNALLNALGRKKKQT